MMMLQFRSHLRYTPTLINGANVACQPASMHLSIFETDTDRGNKVRDPGPTFVWNSPHIYRVVHVPHSLYAGDRLHVRGPGGHLQS